MMLSTFALLALLQAAVGGRSSIGHVKGAAVHVQGDRLLLGAVVPAMPEPWASVDLGAAPRPLQRRILTRHQIDGRLRLAELGSSPVPVPARIEVVRDGQVLNEVKLQALVRRQVEVRLAMGSVLRQLSVEGGLVLPPGKVDCQVPDLGQLRGGRQTVLATIASRTAAGEQTQVRVPVLLDLELPQQAAVGPGIERNQPVTIRIQSGAVTVQSSGIAQLSGHVGDSVAVLPSGGTRVLHGRVMDARTVEVLP